ncbi:MAG: EpsG family protein [Clostridium sp.]|nr:EpsG family protein [Clostridium sp.]MDU7084660.1 EpsG family protein [Clostridium sp.]
MVLLVNILIVYLITSMIFKISLKHKKISFYVNFIILTLITGSVYERIGGGGDYDNYRNIFQYMKIGSELPDKEVVFYYLNMMIKIFTDNFYIAFLIFMAIVNYFVLKIIYKYSENVEASILIYVIVGGYTIATNIVRQFLAAAIYFYSLKYLLDKKYIRYILINVVALGFHSTVALPVVLSIVVFICNDKLNRHLFLYIVMINLLIVIEPIIMSIGTEFVSDAYKEGSFNYGSSILHYIVQLAFCIFYYLNKKYITSFKDKFFVNMSIFSLGFTLISSRMVLYARLASYFNLFHSIATVNVLLANNNVKEKRVLAYFISLGIAIYYLLLIKPGLNQWYNYIIDFITIY